MSHEIRIPMSGVLGMTGLLLGTALSAEQRSFVETIRSSGDALLRIINDILDLSKVEAGLLRLEERPFDLHSLVKEALAILSPRATEKRLELCSHIDAELPPILVGDEIRLRQILLNLVGNALKFTARGKVEVTVSGTAEHGDTSGEIAPRVRLRFAIRDTGIGIAAERMDRLFKNFSQADDTISHQYGGTGLGLAISKRLAELMGGRLWVDSTLGHGSTFFFEVSCASTGKVRGEARAQFEPDVTLGVRQPLRILIVEPQPVSRKIVSLFLQQLSYVAETVGDCQTALAELAQNVYDVMLLSVQMVETEATTAADLLRCEPPRERRPYIIALTNDARPGSREQYLAAGMNDVLVKPVLFEELTAALHQAWVSCQKPIAEVASRIAALDAAQPTSLKTGTWQHLLAAMGDDRETLKQYIDDRLANGVLLLEQLRQALMQENVAALEQLGNSLASLAATLGAAELEQLGRLFAQTARWQSESDNAQAIIALTENYDAVRRELEQCIDEYGHQPTARSASIQKEMHE